MNKKPYLKIKTVEDLKNVINDLNTLLWSHPNRFEGIKCKTCLPLDDVEDVLYKAFNLEK